jgi:ribosomal protein S14
MNKHVYKDLQKRKYVLKAETKQIVLKSIKKNERLAKATRWNASIALTKNSITEFPVKLKKRCIVTGRKNILNKNYRLSRLSFLRHARKGLISGLQKSIR